MSRLRKDPAFAAAFDKRRAQAEVAFQIRRLREAKGWSQKELTAKVGCSRQAISGIEQAGYTRHSLPLLRRVAAALDAEVLVALVPRKAASVETVLLSQFWHAIYEMTAFSHIEVDSTSKSLLTRSRWRYFGGNQGDHFDESSAS